MIKKIGIAIFVLITIISIFPSKVFAAEWYTDTAYLYRKVITIDKDMLSGTVTNFPMLVSVVDTDMGHPGHKVQTDGDDIVFTNSAYTKLDAELESWDEATGTLICWVEVDSISSSADTTIYMFYGKAAATSQWNTNGTWNTNYKAVWHNTGSSTTLADSTSTAFTLTKVGATEPAELTGANAKIYNAQHFDGSNDRATKTTSTSGLDLSTAATFEAWIQGATQTGADFFPFVNRDPDTGSYYGLDHYGSATASRTLYGANNIWGGGFPSFGALTNDTWYHVMWTYDNTSDEYTVYLNGAVVTHANATTDGAVTSGSVSMGDLASLGYYWHGSLDEVRVSDSNRGAAWAKASYNSQNSPSTFYGLGAEQTFGAPTVTTQAASSVEATTATGNGNITFNGGQSIAERGIAVCLASHSETPDTGDTLNIHDHTDAVGAFAKSIVSLTEGTSYHFRAYAINATGTSYGSTVDVLTKPAAPTNVSATDGSSTTKVTITWTKSVGATDYHVWRDSTDLGAAGDAATFDDTGAYPPMVLVGTSSASDGTSADYVTLSLDGNSSSNGLASSYKVISSNSSGNSANSTPDIGYRGTTSLTYQWQRSSADSNANYSNIDGATTNPYNDTAAPSNGDGRYYKSNISMTGATLAKEIDSFSTLNDVHGYSIFDYYWRGQNWTPSENYTMSYIAIHLYKQGSPPNDMKLDIRLTDVDGKPTGAILSTGSISAAAVTTTPEWYIINMSDLALTGGVKYNFMTNTVAGDASNRYIIERDETEIYAGGELVTSNDTGSTWTLYDNIFIYFKMISNDTFTVDRGYRIAAAVTPTVTTQAASSVEATTATGNGNVTDDGGGTITERGIAVCLASHGDPDTGDALNVNDHTNAEGAFTESIISLATGTDYHFRAYAINSAGTGYGSTVDVLTKPAAATSVAATENDATKVVITWTKATGATGYHVYRDAVEIASSPFGDVATADDTGGTAPLITEGSTVATDDHDMYHVGLSLSGTSVANGTSYTYKVVSQNATDHGADSTTDTGYRLATAITYQWQRSSGTGDSGYGDIAGSTASTYDDVDAPGSIIGPGTAVASDGTSISRVYLEVTGATISDGANRYYKCTLTSAGASNTPVSSASDVGFRSHYAFPVVSQWSRSAADSDADYTAISAWAYNSWASWYDDAAPPGDGRYYKCSFKMPSGYIPDAGTWYSIADRGYIDQVVSVTSTQYKIIIVGKVPDNNIYTVPLDGISVVNTSNAAVNIDITGTDAVGDVNWKLTDDATVGEDIYGLQAGVEGGSYNINIGTVAVPLAHEVAASATQKFGFKLYAPSIVTDDSKKVASIILTVSAH
jgi:hypothetical protein